MIDLAQIYDHHDTYPPGHQIFKAGDPGDALYILLEGEVKISLQEHILDQLQNGAIFGEMALVDSQPRSADATTTTECKLVKIDEKLFTELTGQNPKFAIEVMRIMSTRLRRLMIEEITKQRMEKELAIGRDIQLSLIPKSYPTNPGWQFAAAYQAARQVGGDFFDFIPSTSDPDILNIIIADVTGKGVPAALFMASTRAVIRTLCLPETSPVGILAQMNRAIIRDTKTNLFLSMIAARLDCKSGELTLANAGHEWPLWIKTAPEGIQQLQVNGMLLGAFEEISPIEKTVTIRSGEMVVFFTDGITEARSATGEFFGDERLLKIAEAGRYESAENMVARITTAVKEFTIEAEQSDDLTLVVIKRDAEFAA